jgi:hypothetical protein
MLDLMGNPNAEIRSAAMHALVSFLCRVKGG